MNKPLKTALKTTATAALLAYFYSRIDFASLRKIVFGMDPIPIVCFFAVCVVNMCISSVRWKLLLEADGVFLPFRKLFASHWIASFFNFFAPSNIGGDVYRIADIAKKTGDGTKTFASVFADRLTGFLAMSALGFVFPLIGLRGVPEEHRWKLLIPLIVFLAFLTLAFMLWQRTFIRKACKFLPKAIRGKMDALLDKFLMSFAAYSGRRHTIAACLILSLCFQFLIIVAAYAVGSALRFDIAFFDYCVFMPLVCILESVPLTINGMGFRDAAYLMFFNAVAIHNADTAAPLMALLYVSLTLIYASFGGLVFLGRVVRS